MLQVEAERLQESEKANAAHNEKHGARQQIRRIDKELKALQVRTDGLMAQWLRDRLCCLSSSLSPLETLRQSRMKHYQTMWGKPDRSRSEQTCHSQGTAAGLEAMRSAAADEKEAAVRRSAKAELDLQELQERIASTGSAQVYLPNRCASCISFTEGWNWNLKGCTVHVAVSHIVGVQLPHVTLWCGECTGAVNVAHCRWPSWPSAWTAL